MKVASTEHQTLVKSELARLCLPAATRDVDRNLAWMNSICFLFLVIGLFGKPASGHIKPPPAPVEVLPAIIEPVVLQPPPTSPSSPPEPNEQSAKPDAAQVVVVTPDSPAIHFSVPTIGNLVAPASLAVAPPLNPLAPVARMQTASIENTGAGGERPQPPYPLFAREHGQQGTVVLLLNVNEAGVITTIELKESSGYPVLDHSTLDFVKRRWIIPPGTGAQAFIVTIKYRLVAG
jgi:TonB family protein